jgi:ATP-dependent Clp protease ATP-binding subunit ClpB
MTSNLGSELFLNNQADKVHDLLYHAFRPEFLNRIDEIVYFKPLSKDVQYKIVDKMLSELSTQLKNNYISLEFSTPLKQHILESAYSDEFGARPIKRFIQRDIETAIAKAILENEISTKLKYEMDYVENGYQFVSLIN